MCRKKWLQEKYHSLKIQSEKVEKIISQTSKIYHQDDAMILLNS